MLRFESILFGIETLTTDSPQLAQPACIDSVKSFNGVNSVVEGVESMHASYSTVVVRVNCYGIEYCSKGCVFKSKKWYG